MSGVLERLASPLASRYRVDREIGQGGMATVYLARDLKHDRQVALKVLRPELAASLGGERFLAEIRLTARLQHAHIVPLFDSGECGGTLYYVMPYIAGESLRALLDRVHRLDVEGMLAIARPVAEALAYAHELGIVHRDIKPENILLSRGQPFITDFGIARAVSAAGAERLTATGLAVGTPAYMSPEQVLGEGDLDARSDVYSLGCVIYELLSGEPPFAGTTVQALLARRLTGPPPHLANVPTAVDDVVRRSLATAPQDRFASAQALADALVAAARRPAKQDLSIVVLPFENLSPDPDNAFFADGLTEELISDLSMVKSLRVISRTSAMHYKGTTLGVPEISRELNVRYVLEGSVRRAGSSLRITSQLIDGSTDAHVWAEKHTGTVEDVFDLQEEISRRIVEALRAALTPDEDRRLSARPVTDVRALDCYLRALQEIRDFTREGIDRALALTDRALKIVGDNALLHATQALIHWQYLNSGVKDTLESLDVAEACADRALQLDPDVSTAYLAKGLISYTRGHLGQAAGFLERAAALDNNSDALTFLGHVHSLVDRPDAARTWLDRAIASDPFNSWALCLRAVCELLAGDFTAALERFDVAIQGPTDTMAMMFRAITLVYVDRLREARSEFARVMGLVPHWASIPQMWFAAMDRDARAATSAAADLEPYARKDKEISWFYADCLARVGELDQALAWLENAVELGFVNAAFFSTRDACLAPLRGDRRFVELMERARIKQEEFGR